MEAAANSTEKATAREVAPEATENQRVQTSSEDSNNQVNFFLFTSNSSQFPSTYLWTVLSPSRRSRSRSRKKKRFREISQAVRSGLSPILYGIFIPLTMMQRLVVVKCRSRGITQIPLLFRLRTTKRQPRPNLQMTRATKKATKATTSRKPGNRKRTKSSKKRT